MMPRTFLLGEFPLPFAFAPIVRHLLVEAAEVGIAEPDERAVGGDVDGHAFLCRLADLRDFAGEAGVVHRRVGEAIVAHAETGAKRGIPQEPAAGFLIPVPIRGGQQRRAGQDIVVVGNCGIDPPPCRRIPARP